MLGRNLSGSTSDGKGGLFCLVLHLGEGHLGGPGCLVLGSCVVLLGAELVSQTSGVYHCLLGLLLAVLAGGKHVVQVSLHLVDVVLQLPLGVSERVVAGADIGHLLPRVNQLLLDLPLAPDGRLQQSLGLLELAAHGVDLALSQAVSLKDLILDLPLLLDGGIDVTKLHVSPLHGLLALRVSLVGMVKRNLHLVDICLVLLLDPESLLLGPGLSLEGGLHGLQSTLVVLPAVLKLFLLLLDSAIDLLSHLRHLELGPEHLVLLLLKGSLSLFQAVLQLLLLNFEFPARFVQLVHGAPTLTKLVKKVLDLFGEILVLALHSVQMLHQLLVGGLDAEVLRAEVAAFSLRAGDLVLEVLGL